MPLNDRSLGLIGRNIGRRENYQALVRAARVYERPVDALGRYFLGRGAYPAAIGVRTPLGTVRPTAHHSHDMITVHEMFCREDYSAPDDVQVVVDIGSNIGLSALYFLTRNPRSRCVLFEPDPRNVAKLRQNLAAFEDRYELHEVAVADRSGELPFWTEPYGRYGGLDRRGGDEITVQVRHIDDVLASVLETTDRVDVLKLDTEGTEPATVAAAAPALLARVDLVYYESFEPPAPMPGFTASSSCDTVCLRNLSARRPPSGTT